MGGAAIFLFGIEELDDALEEAVRLMQIVGEGREGTPVRLAMSASGLELSATAQERADAAEAIDAKFEGTDLTVAFNPEYLLDGIDVRRLAVAEEESRLKSERIRRSMQRLRDQGQPSLGCADCNLGGQARRNCIFCGGWSPHGARTGRGRPNGFPGGGHIVARGTTRPTFLASGSSAQPEGET